MSANDSLPTAEVDRRRPYRNVTGSPEIPPQLASYLTGGSRELIVRRRPLSYGSWSISSLSAVSTIYSPHRTGEFIRRDMVDAPMLGLLKRAALIYENEGPRALYSRGKEHLYYTLKTWKMNGFGYMWMYSRYWNWKNGTGTSVLELDWDNLIILDGARYDEFIRTSDFSDDEVDCRVTVGCATHEFLQKTFDGENLHDVVYVTANPQVLKYVHERPDGESVFHSVISVIDKWDSHHQTILPEDVYERAIQADQTYPDKRLIIHFMQPHIPYIGEKAAELQDRIGRPVGGLNPNREYTQMDRAVETVRYLDAIEELEIEREEIITAYRESLEIALDWAMKLVSELKGKTAITADHGWLLGEQLIPGGRQWRGHGTGNRSDEMCLVPWVEFDSADRKQITVDHPKELPEIDDNEITDRLRALGYR